jgi:hypothetical protein
VTSTDAEPSPYESPLTYPGTMPEATGLVLGTSYREIPWSEVDAELARRRVVGLTHRTPVLAVGSNAAPAQLRAKLGSRGSFDDPLVVPMAHVELHGLAAGVSGHVSRAGYVPATPVRTDGERSRAFVVWLDAQQLAVVDRTEASYDRVQLSRRITVRHVAGRLPVTDCHSYVSRHGFLVDAYGRPRRLMAQPVLLQTLLDESERLRALAGDSPESWVRVMRDEAARAKARAIWRSEGRVREADRSLTSWRGSRTNESPPGDRLTVRPGDQSSSALS